MMTKQEFMEEYASCTKDELLDLLYLEEDTTALLEKRIELLKKEISEYEQLESEIKKKQKAREERIEYLKHKLIPELEERRENAVTKRNLTAWGIVALAIFFIFYATGSITSFSAFFSIMLVSIFGGGLCLYAFTLLFLATLNKNIQERHDIDKYEHEALLLQIYRTTYFM